MSRGPGPVTVNAGIGLLCLIWGTTWRVIQEGLRDLPPLTSAGLRFAVAACAMVLLAALLHRREGGRPPGWRLVAVLGCLNFGLSYAIVYSCETVLPSGVTAVLWASYPLMMAASGHWLIPGERLARMQGWGFLSGFLGVALLFLTDLSELGRPALAAGALLLLSPLVSAAGSTLVKLHGGAVSSLLLNRNAMLVGAALLLGAAAVLEPGQRVRWTAPAVLSLFYLALVGTVVTFGLFFWLLRYAPASRMSLVAYLMPLVAVAVGALAGEPVGWNTLVGALLVVGGVALAARRRTVPVSEELPPRGLPEEERAA